MTGRKLTALALAAGLALLTFGTARLSPRWNSRRV